MNILYRFFYKGDEYVLGILVSIVIRYSEVWLIFKYNFCEFFERWEVIIYNGLVLGIMVFFYK